MLPKRFVRWMLISLALLLAFTPFATASSQDKPVRIPAPTNPTTLYDPCAYPVYEGHTWMGVQAYPGFECVPDVRGQDGG
jgi:hypothetical protein